VSYPAQHPVRIVCLRCLCFVYYSADSSTPAVLAAVQHHKYQRPFGVFEYSCLRLHSARYGDWDQLGDNPGFVAGPRIERVLRRQAAGRGIAVEQVRREVTGLAALGRMVRPACTSRPTARPRSPGRTSTSPPTSSCTEGGPKSASRWIVRRQVKTFGVDSPTPDNPASISYPVHMMCRREHITHYKNLANLDQVVNTRFTFAAFPLRLRGAHGGPTRAVALLSVRPGGQTGHGTPGRPASPGRESRGEEAG